MTTYSVAEDAPKASLRSPTTPVNSLKSVPDAATPGDIPAARGARAETPGRFQPMVIYGKPAVLDTATGRIVIINPDLTMTVIHIPSATGHSGASVADTDDKDGDKDATQTEPANEAAVKPTDSKPAAAYIPTVITPALRRSSERVIAEYGMNIGRTCITKMEDKSIVSDIELSNNGNRRILAMELTFRGIDNNGNTQVQRLYITPSDDNYHLLPKPGEVCAGKIPLHNITTSNLEMEITYLMLDGNNQ